MTGFASLVVVVIVTTEQAGIRMANLISFGIVVGVATKQTGFTAAYLFAVLIVVMNGAE